MVSYCLLAEDSAGCSFARLHWGLSIWWDGLGQGEDHQ
jgi:hypothetical protein